MSYKGLAGGGGYTFFGEINIPLARIHATSATGVGRAKNYFCEKFRQTVQIFSKSTS